MTTTNYYGHLIDWDGNAYRADAPLPASATDNPGQVSYCGSGRRHRVRYAGTTRDNRAVYLLDKAGGKATPVILYDPRPRYRRSDLANIADTRETVWTGVRMYWPRTVRPGDSLDFIGWTSVADVPVAYVGE